MPSVNYNGITFPSDEEMHMYMWLEEAKKHCIIRDFTHQPHRFLLTHPRQYRVVENYLTEKRKTPKTREISKSLVSAHFYTADYNVESNYGLPFEKRYQNIGRIFIDTKGTYQSNDGGRSFSINQKLVLEKHSIYVHKVVPQEFFQKTFVPEGARYTPTQGKIKKCYIGTRLVREYFDLLEDQT